MINSRPTAIELSPTLVDMILQGKCTLFIGPLISEAPADCLGPPTPAWLAFEMAERMQIQPEKYDLPWVAQLYAERETPNALRSWVSTRLANMRFCPTPAHHLVAQLPFSRIVYTAQDSLLRRAHESRKVPVSYLISGGSAGYAAQQRMIIQLYGSAEQPNTLKLTEDERRRVWDDDGGLGDDLRSWARSDILLFLGYTVNDPELADFYYQLRPQDPMKLPGAYIVGPGVSADYIKYWKQHNAFLYSLDAVLFLQKLAEALKVPVEIPSEKPPLLDVDERSQRDRLMARFEYLSSLNVYVETSADLRRRFEPHFFIQMRGGQGIPGSESGEGTAAQTAVQRDELASLNKLKDGNIEWSQGNRDLARVYFEEALRHNPQSADAYLSLFHLLIEKGDMNGALQVYEDMVRQTPPQAFLPERYQIRKILGQSELGVSYCVFDREENRLVTVTILRRTYALKEEDLAQFASRMGGLSSPRISRILGFNRHRGRTYMLSEYFEGQSLRERLNGGKPLPYLDAMRIAGQIAEALEDGHRQGIPHLNLQPSNILLGPDGAILVSYGFSRLTPQTGISARLAEGDSYDYLSPEQLAGASGDERSDIYALGTILYEMLTGHPPGVGSFQQPSETVVEVTEAVDVLIDHARERYPDRRFATAGEMNAEIHRISLESFKGNPTQYLRVALAWMSQRYEQLTARRSLVFLVPALAILLTLSIIPSDATILRSTARLLLPLLLNSLLVSILIDWAVRAIARRRGLGSLITSGRGIGAILGLIFTLNLISVVGFQDFFQDMEIASLFAAMLAITLFETALALGLILAGGRAAERWLTRYTTGFYWSFVAIVMVELILTILGQPEFLLD
jgi:serine/threonine protein kinase